MHACIAAATASSHLEVENYSVGDMLEQCVVCTKPVLAYPHTYQHTHTHTNIATSADRAYVSRDIDHAQTQTQRSSTDDSRTQRTQPSANEHVMRFSALSHLKCSSARRVRRCCFAANVAQHTHTHTGDGMRSSKQITHCDRTAWSASNVSDINDDDDDDEHNDDVCRLSRRERARACIEYLRNTIRHIRTHTTHTCVCVVKSQSICVRIPCAGHEPSTVAAESSCVVRQLTFLIMISH